MHNTSVLKYFRYLSHAPKLSMDDDKSHPEKRCKIYCNTGSSTLYFTTSVACAEDGIKLVGPVPERPISESRIKTLLHFLYLPSYALLRVTICVIVTVSQSKDSTVF